MSKNGADRHLLLDQIVGWRTANTTNLSLDHPEGNFVLDGLPGAAEYLIPDAGSTPQTIALRSLALESHERLLALDPVRDAVLRIHIPSGVIEPLRTIGGTGEQPRRLRRAQGIAVLARGGIVIADTGNNRVQIFSPPPFALLRVLGRVNGLGRPVAGPGIGEFHQPWGVATTACGDIFIADRYNNRIQRIRPDGAVEAFGAMRPESPTRLAIAPDGRVALLEAERDVVLVMSADGRESRSFAVSRPRSLAYDNEGLLYVGDAIGLIHVFAPIPSDGWYRSVGAGITEVAGALLDIAWSSSLGLVAVIQEPRKDPRLWKIDPHGGSAQGGALVTKALDSAIEHCQWHRVALEAIVPAHATIEIESFTTEEDLPDETVSADDFGQWKLCGTVTATNPDCLVQSGPGRYLRLKLAFRSNGRQSPVLQSIRVFYPRLSYLQYLPAIYQEDDESRLFLDRFLSIFQTEFDRIDHRIDEVWREFDPASVPESHLAWLAAWVALVVDPDWSPAELRDRIRRSFEAYRVRGTVVGLEQSVRDYTGIGAKILEHFRLRRWPILSAGAALDGATRLWSRDFYQRLQLSDYSRLGYFRLTNAPEPAVEALAWGTAEFTVFFPSDPYRAEAALRKVSAVVEREKPAHTMATLCPVYPRLRVGVQATVGIDTAVGAVSHLVLNHLATLNYDTILACSVVERQMRAQGASRRPRAGISTTLL
jgi:phage tail-like protein